MCVNISALSSPDVQGHNIFQALKATVPRTFHELPMSYITENMSLDLKIKRADYIINNILFDIM